MLANSGAVATIAVARRPPRQRGRGQIGSLKRAHHFGLNRTATFGEQLILQDSVTHSISSPLLSFASVGAAAFAAGDKFPLFGATWGMTCPVKDSGLGSS